MTIIDEPIQKELHQLMSSKHDAHELKLLNVGTDRSGEYHWRFRVQSGQIIVLKIEVETDDRRRP